MTRAYLIDLRERVVRQVEAGGSVRRVAAMFAVSPSFVVKLAQAWRQCGTVAARPQGGDRRSTALERHRDWLLQLVAETPDLTLAEIRERLGTPASISAIWRFFDGHGISFGPSAQRLSPGEEPKVCRLRAGGNWIRNVSSAIPRAATGSLALTIPAGSRRPAQGRRCFGTPTSGSGRQS